MSLKPSGEMYLESIYVLSQNSAAVRAIDVAEHMGYSKPSVSRAMGILKKDGYIAIDESGHIVLTDEGAKLSRKIYERHTVLSRVLMLLDVDEETAAEDACRIEHVISDRSFEALKKHLKEKE